MAGNLLWDEALTWVQHWLQWYHDVWVGTDLDPWDYWLPYLGPLVSR